jgi:hypothetical protein
VNSRAVGDQSVDKVTTLSAQCPETTPLAYLSQKPQNQDTEVFMTVWPRRPVGCCHTFFFAADRSADLTPRPAKPVRSHALAAGLIIAAKPRRLSESPFKLLGSFFNQIRHRSYRRYTSVSSVGALASTRENLCNPQTFCEHGDRFCVQISPKMY